MALFRSDAALEPLRARPSTLSCERGEASRLEERNGPRGQSDILPSAARPRNGGGRHREHAPSAPQALWSTAACCRFAPASLVAASLPKARHIAQRPASWPEGKPQQAAALQSASRIFLRSSEPEAHEIFAQDEIAAAARREAVASSDSCEQATSQPPCRPLGYWPLALFQSRTERYLDTVEVWGSSPHGPTISMSYGRLTSTSRGSGQD